MMVDKAETPDRVIFFRGSLEGLGCGRTLLCGVSFNRPKRIRGIALTPR
jgi:hypothetical protein